jgi:hypothetical protein
MDIEIKASEVVKALQNLIDRNGDLPISVSSPEGTSFTIPVGAEVQLHRPSNMIIITCAHYRSSP